MPSAGLSPNAVTVSSAISSLHKHPVDIPAVESQGVKHLGHFGFESHSLDLQLRFRTTSLELAGGARSLKSGIGEFGRGELLKKIIRGAQAFAGAV